MFHNNVSVQASSEYLEDESNPENERFVFAYHVRITNKGDSPAQLLSRHWIITDGNDEKEEVKGDGVIGEQPWIEPGDSFEYSSGAILKTPIGFMQGAYHMKSEDGTEFDADIPAFTLAQPRLLN